MSESDINYEGGDSMQIAICDDEKIIRDIVKEKCEEYFRGRDISYTILMFRNGVELVQYKGNIDIIFLDVEMPQVDGLLTAQYLRDKNIEIPIIFLTSHAELMHKAFKVKAFRYLLKPISRTDFIEALANAIQEVMAKKIIVKYKETSSVINVKDIFYIESLGDNTAIHAKNQYFISNEPLKNWVEVLGDQVFFQTHKSYLVNLHYVKKIEKGMVYLSYEYSVPVSVRNTKKIKEKMVEYIRNNAK